MDMEYLVHLQTFKVRRIGCKERNQRGFVEDLLEKWIPFEGE